MEVMNAVKQLWPSTKLFLQGAIVPLVKLMSSLSIQMEGRAKDHPTTVDRIFSLMPMPCIVLDPTLHIVQVSGSYLRFSNLVREACIGLCIYELDPAKVPVRDVASLRHAFDKAISLRTVYKLAPIKATQTCYYQLHVIPIFDQDALLQVIIEAHDVSGEHTKTPTINDLLYPSETYRRLVDSVKDFAIFMLDARGYVATWNRGAAVLKGYMAEEIIGQHFSIFYSKEDRDADKPGKELAVCLRHGRLEDEGWRYRKDGSRFWANVVINPIHKAGSLLGFSKVTRDLTERKATEARLISAYEESSRLKSEFLANMSHEVRTPMHGMLSAVTLLRDTGLDQKQDELALIIEDSGSTLLQIINDILDYSKLTSGSFTINSEVLSVADVQETALRSFRTMLQPTVSLNIETSPDIPKFAKGDPLRYRQIFENLVANAVKFTESGSIRISTTLTHEDATSYRIQTEIVDTGIGVSVESASLLFEPFTQVFSSTTWRYQGTGLGLAICKSLVDLMGGSIGYRPNPCCKGSIFWFIVRLGKMALPDPKGAGTASPVGSDPREEIRRIASRKQLLLVEDNKIGQMVMLKLLKGLGFDNVDAVSDGAEAVALVKNKPFSYHAILMDINLPVLDGVGATQQIRDMNLDLPIIAMTANSLKGDAETYLSKGMNGYLSKPVNRERLIETLLDLLG